MKTLTMTSGLLLCLGATHCMPVMQQGYPIGIIYNGTTAPSLLNEVEAGGANKASTKSGSACASSVLGVAAFGDAGLDAAKKQGGLTTVNSVEYEATGYVFGVYTQVCTVAHGN
jgi:hypothetical protein